MNFSIPAGLTRLMARPLQGGLTLTPLLLLALLTLTMPSAFAENSSAPQRGHITGKSVLAGALSLIVWPGIGQAVNDNPGKKVGTHALLGLFPPYRFWSGYDGLVDRQGGYWNGKI